MNEANGAGKCSTYFRLPHAPEPLLIKSRSRLRTKPRFALSKSRSRSVTQPKSRRKSDTGNEPGSCASEQKYPAPKVGRSAGRSPEWGGPGHVATTPRSVNACDYTSSSRRFPPRSEIAYAQLRLRRFVAAARHGHFPKSVEPASIGEHDVNKHEVRGKLARQSAKTRQRPAIAAQLRHAFRRPKFAVPSTTRQ